MFEDNGNTDDLKVSFSKGLVSVSIVVSPLRRDEAISLAKAYLGLQFGNAMDEFLENATPSISIARSHS